MIRFRVGSYNLGEGSAVDHDLLRDQLAMLAALDLNVLALQECKGWDADGSRLLHDLAEPLLRMRGFLLRSNHHGCHLVTLVRAPLTVRRVLHDSAPPWWHGLHHLELGVDRTDGLLHMFNVHFAPGSPAVRLAEAESLRIYRHLPAIVAGDMNATSATAGDVPVPEGVDADHAHRKLNAGPALALEHAGFTDVAGRYDDVTPTVGHTGTDRLAYPCDRIHTTLPPGVIDYFKVVTGADGMSDHRPVIAEFSLPPGNLEV